MKKRYRITLDFIEKHFAVIGGNKFLDLGVDNHLSELIQDLGYDVENTNGMDLNFAWNYKGYDVLTAFEVLEHMINPANPLMNTDADYLIASVPLKLWFQSAYWGENKWDKHYHEFEQKQFDYLLNYTGWEIIDSIKFTAPSTYIGIRPILRRITPRYYLVVCKRAITKQGLL